MAFMRARTFTAGTGATAADQNASWAAVESYLSGNLPLVELADGAAGQIIVCNASGVPTYTTPPSRGKSIIAASESRTNTAYGLLTTPDRVQGIVLPSDGLILVGYQAQWQQSVSAAARAAIFIGSNQLKIAAPQGAPQTQAALTNAAGTDCSLVTIPGGLTSDELGTTGDPITTGQVVGATTGVNARFAVDIGGLPYYLAEVSSPGFLSVRGGFCSVFAAAGTYDVSVQFKALSGSVTAKNRKLWVWTIEF